MAERSVAQIMGEGDGFCDVFICTEMPGHGSCDLGHFEGVCQAGSEEITFVIDENLSFVLEPPEA
ncbi:hypothetical protein AAJCM20276_30800 [Acetobacter aceti]|uniref:Uncharacterized protein n=1 Tax=Acetobacter aceti TaxID=435 RepID=A0A6S6PNW0_ACEAC|nr:hypothetical protein AAJCM20276_30800 [Acetobacter aceti]